MDTIIHKMDNTNQNMKIDDTMFEVVELISKHPFKAFTIRELAGLIKTNYATTHRKISALVALGVLSNSSYGMARQIKINLGNEKTISILSLIESSKFERFFNSLKGTLSISINEIIKDTSNLSESKCALIFGSYAKGTPTKESDLDILVIGEPSKEAMNFLKDEKTKLGYLKAIQSSMFGILRTSELRGGPKINPILLSVEEHRGMINFKDNNVAKEALLSHIILKGHRVYWEEIARCINAK